MLTAAEGNHYKIAKLILDRKANVNATNNKGRTALSIAAAPSGGRPAARETLQVLLDHHASTTQLDNKGYTAEDRAVKERHPEAVEILRTHPRPSNKVQHSMGPKVKPEK